MRNNTNERSNKTMSRLPRRFEKHPRLTLGVVTLLGIGLVLLVAEIGRRVFGSMNIQYYTGTRTPGLHPYP
jgi:hypothetical protein